MKLYPYRPSDGFVSMQKEAWEARVRPAVGTLLRFFLTFLICDLLRSAFCSLSLIFSSDVTDAFFQNDADAFSQAIENFLASPPVWYRLVTLFSCLIPAVGVLVVCLLSERRPLSSLGFRRRGAGIEYLLGFGIGALMIGAVLAVSVLCGGYRLQDVGAGISVPVLLLFLLGYVIQGAEEEILCRGFLFVSLSTRSSISAAILISSAVFSVLHASNPGFGIIPAMNVFLCGVFLACYLLRRGSLFGVCAFHTAWNFLQDQLFGISVSGKGSAVSFFTFAPAQDVSVLLSGGDFGIEGSVCTTLILCAAIALLFLIPPAQERKTTGA